jgi:hypothetical protein
MAARLSALRTGRVLFLTNIISLLLVLISVRVCESLQYCGGKTRRKDRPGNFDVGGKGSLVGIATSSPDRVKNFHSPCRSYRLWGSLNFLSNRYRGLFGGVMRPGRESDHSFQTSVEIKKTWIYTSTPPYVFMA